MKILSYIIILLILNVTQTFAQYPHYFQYDNENGLPSNEVYSIVQDKKGFIWLGTDAGLFKFDGTRYTAYKCQTQTSNSVTGLTISSSGKIYCYNFQTQIFWLENDTLKELKHPLPKQIVNNLASDSEENIYATHIGGIAQYSEKTKQWTNYFKYGDIKKYGKNDWVSKSVKGNECTSIPFIYSKGIAEIILSIASANNIKQLNNNDLFKNRSVGNFEIENYQNDNSKSIEPELWIFEKENRNIYRYANKHLEEITNPKLNKLLAGRKITIVKSLKHSSSGKSLPENNLWICTYKGIVKFNPQNNTAELYYPQYSFSDCLIDREGNYWFTTLQNGVLRVPDLGFKVWNEPKGLKKITGNHSPIYFADDKGKIVQFDIQTQQSQVFHQGYDADVQSLDYDAGEKSLWFNVNNHLFKLKNNLVTESNNFDIKAIKGIQKIKDSVFMYSSHGVFINGTLRNLSWVKQLKYDSLNQCIWIASNDGLLKFDFIANKWQLSDTLLPKAQILSVDFSAEDNLLYALKFNGNIYSVSSKGEITPITSLPENVQANKLICHNKKLYLATNRGIAVYDEKQGLQLFNRLSGLVSDNVQDFTISNGSLWIATIKGLQQIPLSRIVQETPLAKIYLKNQYQFSTPGFQLNYNENLILYPEAAHYSSNGNYEYAYRINQNEWLKLPANIEQIELQNLPTGNIEIELKAIDHLNRNSENTILLKGFVKPPFYKTWWFIALCFILFLALVIFIFNRQWKKRQQKMQLENEINVLKLTAVKSQMNPHFIFNVLSSIKGYIYENDRKKATAYLDDFSDLIRTILEKSEMQYTSLTDELNTLKLYIELEAMMFNDFTYHINIAQTINSNAIEIPSLILQPYIENAFKHGLRHKQGDKKLVLSIFLNEKNQCVIEITDNGIGRKQAEELNKRNTLKPKSFATSAMQKRMNYINQLNEKQISINIIDLFDEHNNSTGTKVIFTMQ